MVQNYRVRVQKFMEKCSEMPIVMEDSYAEELDRFNKEQLARTRNSIDLAKTTKDEMDELEEVSLIQKKKVGKHFNRTNLVRKSLPINQPAMKFHAPSCDREIR